MKPFLSNVVYLGKKDKMIPGVDFFFFSFNSKSLYGFHNQRKKAFIRKYLSDFATYWFRPWPAAELPDFRGPTFQYYPSPSEGVAPEVGDPGKGGQW